MKPIERGWRGSVCPQNCAAENVRVVDNYRNGMAQPHSRDHSKTSKNRFYVNLFYLVGFNLNRYCSAILFFFYWNVTVHRFIRKSRHTYELSEHEGDSLLFAGGQKFVVILKLIILLGMKKLLNFGKITGNPLDNNESSTLYLHMKLKTLMHIC